MDRFEKLKQKVRAVYEARNPKHADWANWLYQNHIFQVAEQAGMIASRVGARKELAMAAGVLHDIADAKMSRFDPSHEEESAQIARQLLLECGFTTEEIALIVDDAMKFHSCHNGKGPSSLEGKAMAAADAIVQLTSDFFDFAVEDKKRKGETIEEIRTWARPKIERDFSDKIFLPELREEVRRSYEVRKALFSGTS